MTAQQIEKFIDAGYTKTEIELLFKDPKVDPEIDPKVDPEIDPKEDLEKSSNVNPETNTTIEITNTIKSLTETVNSLANTVKELQANNINNAKTDKPKKDTINEVMKSFVESL